MHPHFHWKKPFVRIFGCLQNRLEIWAKQAWGRSTPLSIFHEFAGAAGGGGNQFLRALEKEISKQGLAVARNYTSSQTKAVLFNSFNFSVDRLARAVGTKLCVHRLDGPIGLYRGFDDGTDKQIRRINHRFAKKTIFQSRFSWEKHRESGFFRHSSHIIMNASDPEFFHKIGKKPFDPSRRVRLISTSWSDNVNKGTETYHWLDQNLDWNRYEYTFVGRIKGRFQHIRVIDPVGSCELGGLLRNHDVFLTASRNDPCSNSLLEALACGLPAVYLNSGGHPEIVREGGIPFDFPQEIPVALEDLKAKYDFVQNRIRVPLISEVTDQYLSVMGFRKIGASYVFVE